MDDVSHSEHHHARVSGPVTPEGFIADRQRFWASFTRFIFAGATGAALVLIFLAIFLL